MEKLIGNLVALKISWRHFSAQLRSVGENKKKRPSLRARSTGSI
jgi:hypothetical protein